LLYARRPFSTKRRADRSSLLRRVTLYECRSLWASRAISEKASRAFSSRLKVRRTCLPRFRAKVRALLDGRFNVAEDDVRQVSLGALRHRVLLNFEGEAESLDVDELIDDLLERVPVLAEKAA